MTIPPYPQIGACTRYLDHGTPALFRYLDTLNLSPLIFFGLQVTPYDIGYRRVSAAVLATGEPMDDAAFWALVRDWQAFPAVTP